MIEQVTADKAYLCAVLFKLIRQSQAAHEMNGADLARCIGADGNLAVYYRRSYLIFFTEWTNSRSAFSRSIIKSVGISLPSLTSFIQFI